MTAAKELIAVSIPEGHPSGSRRRAGFEFTPQPSLALVTAEEKAMIKADPYMTVHRRLSQAWFKAMGIDRTEKNEIKFAKEDPKDWLETGRSARRLDGKPMDSQEGGKPAPKANKGSTKGKDTKDDKKNVVNNFSSKDDVIKALEEKGLKPGKDFDPDAKRDALLAIFNS